MTNIAEPAGQENDSKTRIRVLLIDDDDPPRLAVEKSLAEQADMEYLGCCMSEQDVKDLLDQLAPPDVVLVDMRMALGTRRQTSAYPPALSQNAGLRWLSWLSTILPQAKLVAFSAYFDIYPGLARAAMDAGAHAVADKTEGNVLRDMGRNWADWLRGLIRDVYEIKWEANRYTQALLDAKAETTISHMSSADLTNRFSSTELSILEGYGKDLKSDVIGNPLGYAGGTVRVRKRDIFRKLGLTPGVDEDKFLEVARRYARTKRVSLEEPPADPG